YVDFITRLVRFDFGLSFRYNQDAMDIVLDRLPASLLLAGSAILIGIVVSLPAGSFAAFRRGRLSDTITSAAALIGQSVPEFVLGRLLMFGFAIGLGWLPSFGFDGFASLVLPAITLSVFITARQTRLIRTLMIEEYAKNYGVASRALGVKNWRINTYLT